MTTGPHLVWWMCGWLWCLPAVRLCFAAAMLDHRVTVTLPCLDHAHHLCLARSRHSARVTCRCWSFLLLGMFWLLIQPLPNVLSLRQNCPVLRFSYYDCWCICLWAGDSTKYALALKIWTTQCTLELCKVEHLRWGVSAKQRREITGIARGKTWGDLVPYLFSGDAGDNPPLLHHLAYLFLGTSGSSRIKCWRRWQQLALRQHAAAVEWSRGKVLEGCKETGKQREKCCTCRATCWGLESEREILEQYSVSKWMSTGTWALSILAKDSWF